jgi:hypothetical protein
MPSTPLTSQWQESIARLSEVQRSTRLTPGAALALFVFAVISMGGFLFSHSLGIDDEISLLATDNSWVRFLQGRFLIGLIDLLIPQPVTPLFPYLLLACSYVVSYTIILWIHGLSHNWKTHIGFLVFILFPTNWLSQEFVINVPGFAVGLILACLAAYCSSERKADGSRWGRRFLSPWVIALLVMAIAGFQSLVTVYLVIGAGSLLFRRITSEGDEAEAAARVPLLRSALPWLANATVAVIVHSLLLKALLVLTQSNLHQINIYFRSPYFMLRTQPQPYLLGNLGQFLQTYFTPGIFFGHSLWAFTALLIGSGVLYARSASHVSERHSQESSQTSYSLLRGYSAFFTVLALLAIPLALNLLSTPYRIPIRALMALPYVAWLASTVWLELARSPKSRSIQAMGLALSGLLVVQCLVATSSYYAARAFNFRSDQLVASTLSAAIIQAPNPSGSPVTRLASEGALQRKVPYRTGLYSSAPGSFFNWDNGNSLRMVAWLQAMGIDGIQALEPKQVNTLAPAFATMKPWPAPGSIKVQDGIVLVKFSEQAMAKP